MSFVFNTTFIGSNSFKKLKSYNQMKNADKFFLAFVALGYFLLYGVIALIS